MKLKLYTEIEVEVEVDDMILTHEMTDKARSYYLANLIREKLPGVQPTKPEIVRVGIINDFRRKDESMKLKLYTEIEVEVEVDDMILIHEMTDKARRTDKARSFYLANLIREELPGVQPTKPEIVRVGIIND